MRVSNLIQACTCGTEFRVWVKDDLTIGENHCPRCGKQVPIPGRFANENNYNDKYNIATGLTSKEAAELLEKGVLETNNSITAGNTRVDAFMAILDDTQKAATKTPKLDVIQLINKKRSLYLRTFGWAKQEERLREIIVMASDCEDEFVETAISARDLETPISQYKYLSMEIRFDSKLKPGTVEVIAVDHRGVTVRSTENLQVKQE
jgi:rRNA maturation protein Nop10